MWLQQHHLPVLDGAGLLQARVVLHSLVEDVEALRLATSNGRAEADEQAIVRHPSHLLGQPPIQHPTRAPPPGPSSSNRWHYPRGKARRLVRPLDQAPTPQVPDRPGAHAE